MSDTTPIDPDPPLCGDPTCEGPGCRQSAIDRWYETGDEAAREYMRSWFQERGFSI